MPPERRRLAVLLVILGVVIAAAIYYRFSPDSVQVAGGTAAARAARRTGAPSVIAAPDVQLQALDEPRPKPSDSPQRNLFRFKPKPAPPPAPVRPLVSGAAPSDGPGGPAALAPIPMRFIGIVEAPQRAEKVAVLTDGRGIYHGHEGDIIEGRYRLLRIGVESVDMAYLDGRGRQTIRLSGS